MNCRATLPVKVITADGKSAGRLFDNLINNAIKYGADGKRIMVKLHADDEIVTVSVINYGYVIPADELPLIFNKFYRVSSPVPPTRGEPDLALAISKNIVDMHGGHDHRDQRFIRYGIYGETESEFRR